MRHCGKKSQYQYQYPGYEIHVFPLYLQTLDGKLVLRGAALQPRTRNLKSCKIQGTETLC